MVIFLYVAIFYFYVRIISIFLNSFIICLYTLKDIPNSFFKNYLFTYFWLCRVFVAAQRLSLVAANRGYSWFLGVGFSWQWLLLLQSTGSKPMGFNSAACGIFPDQWVNPSLLHWQADSQPLAHRGNPSSPVCWFFIMVPISQLI